VGVLRGSDAPACLLLPDPVSPDCLVIVYSYTVTSLFYSSDFCSLSSVIVRLFAHSAYTFDKKMWFVVLMWRGMSGEAALCREAADAGMAVQVDSITNVL